MHIVENSLRIKGFTLIELLVVIAIVAILGAIAIPAYNKFMLKGNRPEALSGLSALQLQQQRLRSGCPTYASRLIAGSDPNCDRSDPANVVGELGGEVSEMTATIDAGTPANSYVTTFNEHYQIKLSGTNDSGYTLTAAAVGSQQADGDDPDGNGIGDRACFYLVVTASNPGGSVSWNDDCTLP
jgi:prepilin-type N-terminal cleavage/methylation domain-containing protein